ncbi:MAG: DUF4783 domain-containing protein [Cytophagaceae bacterium]|nr:DUF4783 domain-containing protein [Cytophagaceae bacterium]
MKKNIIGFLCILFLLVLTVKNVEAQNDIINNGKIALKTGSAKELVKYFNDIVELSFDGEKSNYSKTQAEFVLKDFFKKYPPIDFQYIHQGSSKEGLIYAIGKYTYNGGSFRVYILIKQFNGNYLIDTLDFSKE